MQGIVFSLPRLIIVPTPTRQLLVSPPMPEHVDKLRIDPGNLFLTAIKLSKLHVYPIFIPGS